MPHQNYIDGQWVAAKSGQTFESLNPATGEVLGTVPKSGLQDVDAAVEAAARAFPKWRAVPAPRRAEILFRAGELLVRRKEDFARMVTREMGKVIVEGRGDVQEAIDTTYYYAGEGRRMFGFTTPSELPNKAALTFRDPIGVVAAITPWNFPTAIPSWKLMPALVAGNTVVFKPASDTPILGAMLVELLEEAGLPPGVLNLVLGPGGVVGEALVKHPGVSLVSFTGSTASGTEVAVEAARQVKRVALEMGGKNAIIVLDDADLDLAVEGILWSAFGTTGQRCTAASRVIAHQAVRQQLLDRLAPRAAQLKLGNGLDETVNVGPIINAAQLQKVHGYTEVGQREGAVLLLGGERATEGELSRGFFYRPTIFDQVRPTMRLAQEEIFGPTLSIIPVRSLEQAIEVNNGVPYGLTTSIYTADVNRAFQAMRDLTTGLVYLNAGTIGAESHLPFGGTRKTGNGHREGGWTALDIFTEWKTVFVDYSGRLQRAQIDLVPQTGENP
ncbi:MAG: aldehyde dehydrogenase family protein [Chloroflexi bacterium]|nr:aldehyde dehydrogenase family protein [Chloroflexota bacterium]